MPAAVGGEQGPGLPYVIENVPGKADSPEAELRNPIVLCGTQFPGLRVIPAPPL